MRTEQIGAGTYRALGPAEIEPLIEGAVGMRRSAGQVQPIRLPVEDLDLYHATLKSPFTAESAAGMRLRFRTTSRVVGLDVTHDVDQRWPREPIYDLVVDGSVVQREIVEDDRMVVFDGLEPRDKVVEVWLPPGVGVVFRGLMVDSDAAIDPAPHPGPGWAVYGSSITHCSAMPPTETWPAIVARTLGWNLTCLGFNGGCHMDPLVSRAMAALKVERFTLKLGTNVHTNQTLRERTFGPLVHGFLATLRDAHPTTPISVVSPVYSPEREDSAVSNIPVMFGGEPLLGDLTLNAMRQILRDAVDLLRRRGDGAIDYIDGRQLLGVADVDHLPDGLHPDAEGCALIGSRYAALLGT